ncbi:hypothetical protein ACRS6Y_09390 [Bacillus cytotoxicus]|uniref:Lipoprotein n=1 Tax=Bacillus cytotoxicus TaxID=580165 RepID=A0AAX2CHU5_9BACI|nr:MULTISPECIES: hypothetical protein [Bacillus cereus group]AWC28990.1 hypothetical protein CG483_012030 [Bacillus cytotoxicus]AWC32980.1 hypothetical protein CG482_011615 [Bacillus cytotoxicus]AWC37007.1 hypothetical protein CG481_011630 [Bacillus cytotoxicus]AWC39624.1 hypothetical protein CG480_003220 [Bacillus cytotoxicus]AWC47555.1 hypothetical protein CG478_003220 [Bacillus cytotoxicus]
MKMKKITIASVAIGTMLSMTACSGTSTEKDQVKQEQTNVQEDAKTASADATTTTKDTETSTSSNEKTEKDQKTKETNVSDQTTGKEASVKTDDQTASGKTTEKETSTKSADQTTNGKTTKGTKQGVTVKTNVKEVVQLVESLDKHLAANPKLDTVNKLGKQINEKWDVVEKELEASHPTDYKTIGQSIYPLIVGAEKQKIDIAKMKSLTTKTKKDLSQLLTKLS